MEKAVKFIREVKQEGQKVTWPTQKEVITTTIVVLIMVGIISCILLLADTVIASALEFILTKGN